jgi:target of EGR1 protein 1
MNAIKIQVNSDHSLRIKVFFLEKKMSFNIVNRHNLGSLSLAIKLAIQNASFISLDTEFTGLGDGKKTKAANMEDRYIALREVALSHSIIALGLSIFTESTQQDNQKTFSVQNFQFILLSLKDYVISPSSMSFLIQHGFDFNDQFRNGIPYQAGEDVLLEQNDIQCNTIMRQLFIDILYRKCPIVVHNGLLDLMFLYQSFYGVLPPTLSTFVADCSDMFRGGLYDTKYVSDFMTREKASFLSLLYRK